MNQIFTFQRWLLLWLLAGATPALAQTGTLKGNITDQSGAGLPGATVLLKGTTNGVSTDANGSFTLTNVPNGAHTLVISSVGLLTQTLSVSVPQARPLSVKLRDDLKQLDDVIVTGVADARTKLESSVAISTISAKQVEMQAPVSAADVLKNVPGVFVNSALGEIRNVVYSRGVSANSTDADKGYYYVSLQEDGLPVTNITFSNFGPDYFYRTDATMKRLEAVRGGTASIFGANAPGGIFNYVSKTGQDKFGGELRLKYGREGNGNYYRSDLNFGGALSPDGKWTYNLGGFYRYSEGARNPGYPLNVGGQVKGNLTRNFDKGFVRFYGKYLNDRNGWFEFIPVKDFERPTPAPGVSNTTSYLPPPSTFDVPFGSATNLQSFDPSRLARSRDYAAGLEFQYDLSHDFSIRNNFKYSNKDINWNSSAQVYPLGLDNANLHNLFGTRGIYGTYSLTRHGSNEPLAVLDYQPTGTSAAGLPTGDKFAVTQNNLPGQGVLQNGVVTQLGLIQLFKTQEVMDQLLVSKKLNAMTFTAGGYYGRTHLDYESGRAGVGLTTIENQPTMIDVTLRDLNGNTRQVTNGAGWGNLGGQGAHQEHHMTQDQKAFFLGYDWAITDKLNVDAGARYEHIRVFGTASAGGLNAAATADNQNRPTYGGVDGNPLTLYDNKFYSYGPVFSFDKVLNTLSYSGGLNFKLTPQTAIYGRYSVGKKAPDLSFYIGTYQASQYNADNIAPQAQTVQQAEIGFKTQRRNLNLFITPFYSQLSNIYTFTSLVDENLKPYVSDPVYNRITTYGVEVEGDYNILATLNLRAVATVQSSKATNWGIIRSTVNGRADDYVDYSYSGNKADNTPNLMLNVTGTYTRDKYYTYLGWKFMGARPANVANAFTLPSFSQFDLGLGYNVSSKFSLSGNINNLLQSLGIMSWAAPGGFPLAGDRQGFVRVADPNATYFAILVQPRSYYLTGVYRF
ncbi:MAG: hypothetical protein EOO55_01685 [Hymenobacter sp.]|nr:MAG: hypothetical protein EOO55_01685 [Hymenobacter sp.]